MRSISSVIPRCVSAFAIVVSLVAALGLAACSSSAKPNATSAAGSNSAAASPRPTGAPIKTVTIAAVNYNGPTYQSIKVAAQLYESWINDHGGINGRPLQVTFCDDKGVAAQTSTCARAAVSDGAVADVGSFTFNAAVTVPIYNDAKTAVFGGCCNLSSVEFSSPNTFQMGDNPALVPGGVARAVQDGCKHIGVLELDLPSTATYNTLYQNVAKAYGYTGSLKFVKISLAATDYSSQVAQVTDGTDCIALLATEANIAAMMPAFAQTGGTQRLYGGQGNLDNASTKGYTKLPGVANAVVVGAYPPLTNAVWANFRSAISTYHAPSNLDYNSEAALGTWAAYTAFTQIVTKMTTTVTPANFLAAASTSVVDTGGMTPTIDFTKTWSALGGAYARSFSRQVTYYKLSDNSQVGSSVYYDLTNPLQGNAP